MIKLATFALFAGLMASAATASAQPYKTAEVPAGNFVKIETARGPVVIQLFPDVAPEHVKSFKYLINKGFYNGLSFHRVVPNFVVQGGDPKGDGTGGPGYTLKAEFSDLPHKRGTLAMARSASPDSAGSQFYIVLDGSNVHHLDGQYTIFGQVVEGMENVDNIVQGDLMTKLDIYDSQEAADKAE